MVSLAERRRSVTYLSNEYDVSERRACQAMQMNRSSYRYVGRNEFEDERYPRLVSLSHQYPYRGYRKIYELLRGEELAISREGVRLIRRREGLQVVRKRRKRKLLGTTTQWVNRAQFPNHVWRYDVVFNRTWDARQLKCMTVVDEFTRQGFAITVGRSLTSGDSIDVLELFTKLFPKLFLERGRPACLLSDNRPETVSSTVQKWLKGKPLDTHYIDPGSPWQNGYCESFNSIFRTTCLDRWLFSSMTEARVVINHWLDEYNTIRPHGSLGGMNPKYFLQRWIEGNISQQQETLTS